MTQNALIVEIESLRQAGGGVPLFEGELHGNVQTSCFVLDLPPGLGAALHRHPYPEVFVLLDGEARVWMDGVSTDVHGGQIAIVPSDAAHRFTNTGEGVLRTVNVHPHPRRIQEDLPAGAEPAPGMTSTALEVVETESLRPPGGGAPVF